MLRFRFSPIWHNWDFLKLWFGETVSSIGSQVTLIAFPLTAVTLLHASAFQMAILTATDTIPIILFGLFIGVWVDRQKRRPLLIMSNVVRILLLCSVPISYTLHLLTMEQL
ncbi:hypothetical protein EPA93_14845 [Ktedonosporobacter rubrisoli]|uniref:MFS transporter n=1 Tax=Ktedonosporobacter rubrisoli TaxID=2509675 RepID=A0A4P6JR02_KTERU|nr:MFS transporter [Ktedonosporobacter rubrisoli]QBD77206.1 hypothetical protein EPA93_14845 [Ktedonosporobacter rubrisoli]